MTLGEKIQWGRRRSSLSQQQLAEKLCVSRSAIAKWETDKGLPDVDNLRQLSKLLGMSVDNLLSEDAATLREPCCYTGFPGCSRVQKDALMRRRFPGATITPLLVRPDGSATQPDSRSLAFYLVESETEQLFVTVSQDFLQLRPMEEAMTADNFHLEGYHFLRLHPLT